MFGDKFGHLILFFAGIHSGVNQNTFASFIIKQIGVFSVGIKRKGLYLNHDTKILAAYIKFIYFAFVHG